MAEEDHFEHLNIGAKIACKTCNGAEIKGEVTAYDEQTKMVILKMPPTNGNQGMNDVIILNLDLVSKIDVLKPARGSPRPLPAINVNKISQRLQQKLLEKQRQMSYIGVDVSPEAQKLFNFITRTVKEVVWEEQNIRVLDTVVISPPYTLNEISSDSKRQDSRALQHVQKLVGKYYKEMGVTAE